MPVVHDAHALSAVPAQVELMKQLGTRSVLAVPVLASDGHALGAIAHHFHEPHPVSEADLYRATMYARLIAAVLEHVRVREQAEVREALLFRRRSEVAAVTAERLALSLDWAATIDNAARVALPALADLCLVSVAEDGAELARAGFAHVDADKERWLRELALGAPVSEVERAVARSRRPQLWPDPSGGASTGPAPVPRELDAHAAMLAPMVTGNRVLGVLVFCTTQSHRLYDADDLVLADLIASRAAQALDHALTHKKLQQALRAHDEFLAIVSPISRTSSPASCSTRRSS